MKPFRPSVQLKLDPVCAQIACFLPRFKSTFCVRFPTPHACYTFRSSKRPCVPCRGAAPHCQFSPPLCVCQRSVAKLGDAVLRLVYAFSSPFAALKSRFIQPIIRHAVLPTQQTSNTFITSDTWHYCSGPNAYYTAADVVSLPEGFPVSAVGNWQTVVK
jgi:hypothetical protein